MTDMLSTGQALGESEGAVDVPVNPYSLLEAVNGAAAAARNSWVLFLALITYLLIAVAGVTHTDLLLNSPIPLPVLQVKIELRRFFLFAPIVLLFLHFGLLIQHAMLGRKVLEFNGALMSLEPTRRRTHPLRLELNSYFYAQALAGPVRSWLFGVFLQGMSWLSFVVIPVILILYTQVVFLPFHDGTITWVHRVTLLVDILILIAIGVFLSRPEASFFGALWRTVRHQPAVFFVTMILMAVVVLFSFFVATIPGERLDRLTSSLPGYRVSMASAMRPDEKRYVFALTAFLFEGGAANSGAMGDLFRRNLVVKDEDLVPDSKDGTGEKTINLRGRHLEGARLDRSDLHRADLTGAKLEGASLVGVDLRGARFACPDVGNQVVFGRDVASGGGAQNAGADNGEEGASRTERGPTCVTELQGVDFSKADISGADMRSVDLTGANFKGASAAGVNFTASRLVDVTFEDTQLQRADFSGAADLTLAHFLGAHLQGANFNGARLLGAEFLGAELQGVDFNFAWLQGASFLGATLDAANLASAKLQGADLFGASFKGASIVGAQVWLTVPPEPGAITLVDLSNATFEPPSAKSIQDLEVVLKGIGDERIRKALAEKLSGLLDSGVRRRWENSGELAQWRQLADQGTPANPDAYREQLTRYLTRIMCQVQWGDGSVASGIVVRALKPSGFQGDLKLLFERLTSDACPASQTIDKELIRKLSAVIEQNGGINEVSPGAGEAAQ